MKKNIIKEIIIFFVFILMLMQTMSYGYEESTKSSAVNIDINSKVGDIYPVNYWTVMDQKDVYCLEDYTSMTTYHTCLYKVTESKTEKTNENSISINKRLGLYLLSNYEKGTGQNGYTNAQKAFWNVSGEFGGASGGGHADTSGSIYKEAKAYADAIEKIVKNTTSTSKEYKAKYNSTAKAYITTTPVEVGQYIASYNDKKFSWIDGSFTTDEGVTVKPCDANGNDINIANAKSTDKIYFKIENPGEYTEFNVSGSYKYKYYETKYIVLEVDPCTDQSNNLASNHSSGRGLSERNYFESFSNPKEEWKKYTNSVYLTNVSVHACELHYILEKHFGKNFYNNQAILIREDGKEGEESGEFKFKIKLEEEPPTEIIVKKYWQYAWYDESGKKVFPDATFVLYANGKKVSEVVEKDSKGNKIESSKTIEGKDGTNKQTVKWENLPQMDSDGNKITYEVKEEPDNGEFNGKKWALYDTVVNGNNYTFKNSFDGEEIEVEVEKKWTGQSVSNYPKITFTLYADGTPVSEVSITGSETKKFENKDGTTKFPKKKDGKEIVYVVQENPSSDTITEGSDTLNWSVDGNQSQTVPSGGGTVTFTNKIEEKEPDEPEPSDGEPNLEVKKEVVYVFSDYEGNTSSEDVAPDNKQANVQRWDEVVFKITVTNTSKDGEEYEDDTYFDSTDPNEKVDKKDPEKKPDPCKNLPNYYGTSSTPSNSTHEKYYYTDQHIKCKDTYQLTNLNLSDEIEQVENLKIFKRK